MYILSRLEKLKVKNHLGTLCLAKASDSELFRIPLLVKFQKYFNYKYKRGISKFERFQPETSKYLYCMHKILFVPSNDILVQGI